MIYKTPSNFSVYGSLKVLYQKYTCIILTVRRLRATLSHLIYSTSRAMQQEWGLFIVWIPWVPSIHQQRSGLCCARHCKHMRKNIPAPKELGVSPMRNERSRSSQKVGKHKSMRRQKQHSTVAPEAQYWELDLLLGGSLRSWVDYGLVPCFFLFPDI